MRKSVCIAVAMAIAAHVSAQLATDAQKQFIKGNLSEKTAAIREATGSDIPLLSQAGLDFVILNKSLLGNDRELSALAAASVLVSPVAAITQRQADSLSDKLTHIFSLYDDETVRIVVLEKLVPLSVQYRSEKAVALVNEYLRAAAENETTKAAVAAAGAIGDSATFGIIYDAWKTGRWPSLAAETDAALAGLSERLIADAVQAISVADVRETYAFFMLLTGDEKKSPNFRAEIAENALSKAIYTTEDLSGSMEDTISLQTAAVKVIAECHWVRASQLVIRYFSLAREEYEANVLGEAMFTDVIVCMSQLASPDTAQALSAYLADLNRHAESNDMPAKPVVLAVISALGALGDKAAFDNLLYVTYLPYPQDVIAAARSALAKLKW
ncbi:MAG: hypothetical protein K2N31_02850 [Treponemataceae bacterium]|nr:hypothetical protein [Treponemataceae bacterium]